jgi:hypothetical protein
MLRALLDRPVWITCRPWICERSTSQAHVLETSQQIGVYLIQSAKMGKAETLANVISLRVREQGI